MDDRPMDRPCYVNLDPPNGRRSNGPPILRQFGPSKITVVDSHFELFKNMVVNRNFGPSKITVGDRDFGPLKIERKKKKKNMVKVLVNTTVGQLVAV